MTEMAMNKIIAVLLMIMIIFFVVMFIFNSQLIEWFQNIMPEIQEDLDKDIEIDIGELAKYGVFECPEEHILGEIRIIEVDRFIGWKNQFHYYVFTSDGEKTEYYFEEYPKEKRQARLFKNERSILNFFRITRIGTLKDIKNIGIRIELYEKYQDDENDFIKKLNGAYITGIVGKQICSQEGIIEFYKNEI